MSHATCSYQPLVLKKYLKITKNNKLIISKCLGPTSDWRSAKTCKIQRIMTNFRLNKAHVKIFDMDFDMGVHRIKIITYMSSQKKILGKLSNSLWLKFSTWSSIPSLPASIGYNSFVSTPIWEPFKVLDSWLLELQNDIWFAPKWL